MRTLNLILSLALTSITCFAVYAEEPRSWEGTITTPEITDQKAGVLGVLTVDGKKFNLLADGDLAKRVRRFAYIGYSKMEVYNVNIHVQIKGIESQKGIKVSSLIDLETGQYKSEDFEVEWTVNYYKKRPKINWANDGSPSIDAKPDFSETMLVEELYALAETKTEKAEPDAARNLYTAVNILKDGLDLKPDFIGGVKRGIKFLKSHITNAAKDEAKRAGVEFDGNIN